jgi:hypothetical protein
MEAKRVPIIRLKLKVQGLDKPNDKIQGLDKASENMTDKKVKEDGNNEEVVAAEVEVEKSNESINICDGSTSASITSTCTNLAANNHGTFLYRPFKLFPLLPCSARYRVLIPKRHIHTVQKNPAVRLNYFWRGDEAGVYTDDSDLVCILLKEKMILEEEQKNKDLLVEVEVVSSSLNDMDTNSGSPDGLLCPRKYGSAHDGNYIKIHSCKPVADGSSVHLKRWRKNPHGRREPQVLTPKFKTKFESSNGNK